MAKKLLAIEALHQLSKEKRIENIFEQLNKGLTLEDIRKVWDLQYPVQLYPILKKLDVYQEVMAKARPKTEPDGMDESAAGVETLVREEEETDLGNNSEENITETNAEEQNVVDNVEMNQNEFSEADMNNAQYIPPMDNEPNGQMNTNDSNPDNVVTPMVKRRGRRPKSETQGQNSTTAKRKMSTVIENPDREQKQTIRFQISGVYDAKDLTDRLLRLASIVELTAVPANVNILIEMN